MTTPNTTMMLGSSRTSAKRPSRVRDIRSDQRDAGWRPAVGLVSAVDMAPAATGGPGPGGSARDVGVELRGGGVQRGLGGLLAQQRVLDLDLQRLRRRVVVGDRRAQDHVR